jgi:hypothetical protein
MGYGSVSNEIKGKRNAEGSSTGWQKSLLSIKEEGAKFRWVSVCVRACVRA